LGFLALQIPVSKIIGAKQSFTFFDFFAPTTGMFLNCFPGAVSVLIVKMFDLVFIKKSFDLISLLRLLPLPLAAFYFGSKSKLKSLIALLSIFLFVIHPIGRSAWLYSLYWLIPVIASFFPRRLFLKSLGSTFTAHAMGSTIFLYTVGLTPQVWLSLIPVTFMERVGFSLGIYASYFIFNFTLNYLVKLLKLKSMRFLVEKQYLPSRYFLLKYA
jgi:hypothetical protein